MYKNEHFLKFEKEHQYYLRTKLLELQELVLADTINNEAYFKRYANLQVQSNLIKELLKESQERPDSYE